MRQNRDGWIAKTQKFSVITILRMVSQPACLHKGAVFALNVRFHGMQNTLNAYF